MIDPTTTAVTASLYAARVAPPEQKLAEVKPDPTPPKPMSAAGDVPNLAAMGIYSNPTATSGAPGQAEDTATENNGKREYNDAVTQIRKLAMLKAATSYAQVGAVTVPPVQPVVNAAV